MLKFIVPLAIMAGLVIFLAMGLDRNPQEVPSPLIGKMAPPFTLPSVADAATSVSLQDFRGQYVALNVWGSWCPACRDEHNFLLQVSREGRVPLVGLNWKDTRAAAQNWLRLLGNPYQVTAFDPVGDVAIDWGVYGAPETFLVDPDGRIVHKHIGPLNNTIWQQEFVSRMTRP